jgi:hypothetical protein
MEKRRFLDEAAEAQMLNTQSHCGNSKVENLYSNTCSIVIDQGRAPARTSRFECA